MIGLSSGSWAQILAHRAGVEHVTIVEINPAYLELIPKYPSVASLLTNPKVEIIIDDGRRWLAAHPERRFDLIASNTSFHWRAGATNLLSVEFMATIRAHMNPGAIMTYNTTSSNDAQKTGATVFRHALRTDNFLVVSDSPLRVDLDAWRGLLQSYRIDGRPVFDLARPRDREKFDSLVLWASRFGPEAGLETGDSILARTARNRLITDDNMGVEWTLGDRAR